MTRNAVNKTNAIYQIIIIALVKDLKHEHHRSVDELETF